MSKCPLTQALDLHPKTDNKLESISDNSVFGPAPQLFIGSYNYPSVYSGPLTSLNPDSSIAKKSANPAEWVNLSVDDIIDLRFGLLRGKQKTHVKPDITKVSHSIKNKLEELSLSINPVEVEGLYSKRPDFSIRLNGITQPTGPSGFLTKFDLTSNPKIPKSVDQIVNDELRANEQMNILYSQGYDVYYLQNIFSSGALGLRENSRLVPTQWSITAVDDTIGKQLIAQLRDLPLQNEIEVLTGDFLGNYFTCIFLPGKWTYENYETWLPGNIFTLQSTSYSLKVDREGFEKNEVYKGRTRYSVLAGGYYATRLAILEFLHKIHRQARIVIIREITSEYSIPMGVWAVREGMRKTLQSNVKRFGSLDELLKWLPSVLKVNLQTYLNTSETFSQSSLEDFF
ncbi:MAG: hypothetical protein ACXAD7_25170 [Candidatus Kariarchaeaceae archaeon]